MLERLTDADFTPLIGRNFRVRLDSDGDPYTLRLAFVASLGSAREPGGREPFSLQFTASDTGVLPQSIYHLESDFLPPLDIFLVPIGQDANRVTYEAIFT